MLFFLYVKFLFFEKVSFGFHLTECSDRGETTPTSTTSSGRCRVMSASMWTWEFWNTPLWTCVWKQSTVQAWTRQLSKSYTTENRPLWGLWLFCGKTDLTQFLLPGRKYFFYPLLVLQRQLLQHLLFVIIVCVYLIIKF